MNVTLLALYIADKQTGREEVNTISVDENGIIGDKFYAKDKDRSILVTSLTSYELAIQNGINTPYGSLGENILVKENIYHLTIGEKFFINNVEFEVTQPCTICKSLAKVDPKLPKLLKCDRGIFVKATSKGNLTLS